MEQHGREPEDAPAARRPARCPAPTSSELDSREVQNSYIGALNDALIVFDHPVKMERSVHLYDALIPHLDGPMPEDVDLPETHSLRRRVTLAARTEYARLRDPLLTWSSASAVLGPMRRILQAVTTNPVAVRGEPLNVSSRVMAQLGLDDLAAVSPDLSMGLVPDDILVVGGGVDEYIDVDNPNTFVTRHGVVPTLSGISLDEDWFHFLFIEAKPGGVGPGLLRVVTAMRSALSLTPELYVKAREADAEHCSPIADVATVYGVVVTGVSCEVHCMRMELDDDEEQAVRFETRRVWEGHIDRPEGLVQLISLLRSAAKSAERRVEVIGNWLWCMYDDADVEPVDPRRGSQKRRADPPETKPAPQRHAAPVAPAPASASRRVSKVTAVIRVKNEQASEPASEPELARADRGIPLRSPVRLPQSVPPTLHESIDRNRIAGWRNSVDNRPVAKRPRSDADL